jgi:hypothetical protein
MVLMERTELCPSAPAQEGAIVLGVVGADGSIAYIRDRLVATRQFVDIASAGREPEQRFRFASPCQRCACQQWVDGNCSVPGRAGELVPPSDPADGLPRCAIRPQCRWYRQSGAAACRICPWVITRGPRNDEISSAATREAT